MFLGRSCRIICRISFPAIRFFCSSTFAIFLTVAMFSVIIFAAALDAARAVRFKARKLRSASKSVLRSASSAEQNELIRSKMTRGVHASVYNVIAKTWIAPSEPVDDLERGKERAAAHAQEYLN
jgi:preprotein translocase subunit SecE